MKTFSTQQSFGAGSVLVALLVMAVVGLAPIPAHRAEAGKVLLGLYAENVNALLDIDVRLAPTGKRTNMVGTYLSLDSPIQSVPSALISYWGNGYVPFVNLMTTSTTAAIANGDRDAAIRNFAHYFALWAATGRRAFLAPLPEMNGRWHQDAYYGPPATFIQAFRRIRQIFEEELTTQGAPLTAVSWVFAPNGWSEPGDEFERYYPGADVVDVVSTTGFNFGGCPGSNAVWDTFDTALNPFLDRLGPMAPGKPLFITETGTVDVQAQGVGNKDQWLQEFFTRLTTYPRFRGVVYFNLLTGSAPSLPACPQGIDYRLTRLDGTLWPGFANAMATLPQYAYWAPDSPQMANIVFGRQLAQIFADVPTIHPFALEDGEPDFAPWIHALRAAGVTQGCGTVPLRYCPDGNVTRAQMAVFLLKAKHGGGYVPQAATGMFGDVPADNSPGSFAPWIEALAAEGITGGCGGGNFCPTVLVTRAQMAIFLVRAFNLPQ